MGGLPSAPTMRYVGADGNPPIAPNLPAISAKGLNDTNFLKMLTLLLDRRFREAKGGLDTLVF